MQNNQETIAKYDIDVNVFRLGSTNPEKKYPAPGCFLVSLRQSVPWQTVPRQTLPWQTVPRQTVPTAKCPTANYPTAKSPTVKNPRANKPSSKHSCSS